MGSSNSEFFRDIESPGMSPLLRTSSWIAARVCGGEVTAMGMRVHAGKN